MRTAAERAEGPGGETGWYVDDRCIDCDAARQLAPGLVGRAGGRSVLLRQPSDEADLTALRAAAYACPTRSIRHTSQPLDPSLDPFPLRLDDRVHLCGHNSRQTAGANSYLLGRDDGSSMMVDTPRWSDALAGRFEALGPVTDVLLTHRDHAAHGRRYADRFGARLWIHEGDLDAAPDADRVIRGIDPLTVGEGVVAHPLPGHTRGSVLYVADDRYCFSGDSFHWSRTTGDIEVVENVTWYSIEELAASLVRSAPRLRFEWLLPGHGDRRHLPLPEMTRRLRDLATRAQALRPRPVDFSATRW